MSAIQRQNETINSFYSAAAGEVEWSLPLKHLTDLCGGVAATLELIDLQQGQSILFESCGINPANADDYVNHFQMIASRVHYIMRASSPDICCDYQIMSEKEMDADAFYADFLARDNMRYFISGRLKQTADRYGLISVQRSTGQGHVGKHQIAIFKRLLPHMRRAMDFSQRFEKTLDYASQLEHALDQLTDGVVLISSDGTVSEANTSAREMFRGENGLTVREKMLDFANQSVARKFYAVLRELTDKDGSPWGQTEFLAARNSNGLPYALSVYPANTLKNTQNRRYLAIVFIRDLDRQRRLSAKRIRTVLCLT
ncbi:MAG: PAS domain-containing protein, partial [Fimbriimonadaceae bacterium]|nr:PAS domain-containing protein [Alphaproteobacteria bacterium]